MNKGLFISRKESLIIQGIAVILMVFHHLFGFPDRISYAYVILSDFSFFHIGTILSYFGRICISMFAFCSGYGLYKKFSLIYQAGFFVNLKNGYLLVIKQALKFYTRYWLVCAVFIPIGYIMGVYSFDLIPLLKCLIGISCPYNAEWWYVSAYLQFLLVFPVIFIIEKTAYKIFSQIGVNVFYVFLFITAIVLTRIGINKFTTMLCFVAGIACVSTNLFDYIYSKINKFKYLQYVFAVLVMFALILLRIVLRLECNYDYICAPIFVFGIGLIIKSNICIKTINKLLLFVGKYSTYIWLIHTFLAYYYFQQYLYWFRFSTIIFIVCIICCILFGVAIEFINKSVNKLIKNNSKSEKIDV